MKIQHLLLYLIICLLGITANSFGQNPANHPIRCGTTEHMEFLKTQNPGLANQMIIDEQHLQQIISNQQSQRTSNTVYTIPVVVHVVYKTTGQNISDAQVQSQIDVLNEDFGRTNPD